MAKPSKHDPSKPQVESYDYKKAFYRSTAVADDYDQHRFTTPARIRRNERKWRAIGKALAQAPEVKRVLDLPCGTGRFTGRLASSGYEVIGSDISLEMIGKAVTAGGAAGPAVLGYVQANGEKLPFRNAAVDCVVSIRFMFHVDPDVRIRILREFGRVARRQVVDYRHRYSMRYRKWQALRALGLTREPLERVSRERLEHEFTSAGLTIRAIVPVSRGWFSDKWVVLSERTAG
ncbi:MAG TPA: methyltransferase domain-containing protein [Steroidobacteraceae bacterium]|nr:methyltransferase domain-containing protein [Steroidobacteraceae bacterium]